MVNPRFGSDEILVENGPVDSVVPEDARNPRLKNRPPHVNRIAPGKELGYIVDLYGSFSNFD